MDSITQIVLGAACGEAVLGKKIGNKALLFGAIGGTIPDLDVFLGDLLYSNAIQAMAFHRGIMHSIFFSILASLLLGSIFKSIFSRVNKLNSVSKRQWIKLFFLSLLTHSLLDCFTAYGTQLFSPFSDYRVAFNTISVVDPIYTLPFLISLILLMFFNRQSNLRAVFLKIGFVVSSCYVLLTITNKCYVNYIFKQSLEDSNIDYLRFRSQPTILNNVLWYSIIETDNNFQYAYYSIFDSKGSEIKWREIPKKHYLLPLKDKNIQTLIWFSDGYFSFTTTKEKNTFFFNDLRYPLMDENDINSSVFRFLIKKTNQEWDSIPFETKAPDKRSFQDFWTRLKGI
ncbi:MAG: metal-dependent hydrolase [Flavobacteriaceae bacterium]